VITPMARLDLVVRQGDREQALAVLADLGALHVVPAEPARAVAEPHITAELEQAGRALQLLAAVKPSTVAASGRPSGRAAARPSARPDVSAREAVREALEIRRRGGEAQARLAALHRRVRLAELLGAVPPEVLDDLERAGAAVRLYAVPDARLAQVHGDVVYPVGRLDRTHAAVAVVGDPLTSRVPEGAHPLPPPVRDRAAIQAEAAAVEEGLRRDARRLAELAHVVPEIVALRERLQNAAAWSVARRSALQAGPLCGLQGWIPEDAAGAVEARLSAAGIPTAVRWRRPEPGERPPTLIRYAGWARPIRGLLDMLGTVPGYDEIDVSAFFMIALPVFAGMLIGDAAYGLLFVLAAVLLRRRLHASLGPDRTALLAAFGVAALTWGGITGVWFGFTPAQMMEGAGVFPHLGDLLYRLQLVRGTEDQARVTIIKICFGIGAVHLIAAHIRRALALAPDPRSLAEGGWCMVLAAMTGVIWSLFFGATEPLPAWLWPTILGGFALGLVLVIGFAAPHRSPLRRVGMGLAGSLLPLLGTFSDTLSYIRLMAVGLASYYIGAAFNTLAFSLAGATSWLAAAPVLVFGHSLNLALVLIAIFAHGVRLNMLEFSSNAGVQWTGYPFRPFATPEIRET
jgi:V/A-type H+/Na+-transporting ATPase subunit I